MEFESRRDKPALHSYTPPKEDTTSHPDPVQHALKQSRHADPRPSGLLTTDLLMALVFITALLSMNLWALFAHPSATAEHVWECKPTPSQEATKTAAS